AQVRRHTCGQARRGYLPRREHRPLGARDALERDRTLGVELGRAPVVLLELGQPGPPVRREREHVGQRRAVLPAQLVQELATSPPTWKRRSSISRARARSSPPSPPSVLSIVASAARASRNETRSTGPNASSAARWARVDNSAWWACWPYRSTRRAPSSVSSTAVASRPSRYARLRPAAGTTRRTTTSSPSS